MKIEFAKSNREKAMLQKWVVSLVISFVLRQLAKYQDQIDWAKVKADFEKRAADLMPGFWFDDEVKALAGLVIDACQEVLSEGDQIEKLLKALALGEWDVALLALKELLLNAWKPKEGQEHLLGYVAAVG